MFASNSIPVNDRIFAESYYKIGFDNTIVDNAFLIKNAPLRIAPRLECDIVKVNLSTGDSFSQFTSSYTPDVYRAKSEDVSYLDASSCVSGYQNRLTALVFYQQSKEIAIGVPFKYVKNLPYFQAPPPFGVHFFKDVDKLKTHMPDIIVEYGAIDEEYIFFGESAIKFATLKFANLITQKFYIEAEYEEAMHDIFNRQLKDASFAGITAQTLEIIRIGILLLLIFMYDLWRKCRVLPLTYKSSQQYWIVYDSTDFFGLLGSIIFGIFPIIFSTSTLFGFLHSQGMRLIIFGYIVDVESLWNLDFAKAPPSGWLNFDFYASIMIAPSIAYLLLSVLISVKLVSISWKRFKSGIS